MGKMKELYIETMELLEFNLNDHGIYLNLDQLNELMDNYFKEYIYNNDNSIDAFIDKYIYIQYNNVSDLIQVYNFISDFNLFEWYNEAYSDDFIIILGDIVNAYNGYSYEYGMDELLGYLDNLLAIYY